jgi:hypothetical protein
MEQDGIIYSDGIIQIIGFEVDNYTKQTNSSPAPHNFKSELPYPKSDYEDEDGEYKDGGGIKVDFEFNEDLLKEDFMKIRNSNLFNSSSVLLHYVEAEKFKRKIDGLKIMGSEVQYDPQWREYKTIGKYDSVSEVVKALKQITGRNYGYQVEKNIVEYEDWREEIKTLESWDDPIVIEDIEFILTPVIKKKNK